VKEKIHPKYVQANVQCACGNKFTTGSTKADMHVDVCAKCHPFFTGKQHILDIQGRVERFNKRLAKKKSETAPSAEAATAR
jgi:large subunit ribosomal protein L31